MLSEWESLQGRLINQIMHYESRKENEKAELLHDVLKTMDKVTGRNDYGDIFPSR